MHTSIQFLFHFWKSTDSIIVSAPITIYAHNGVSCTSIGLLFALTLILPAILIVHK